MTMALAIFTMVIIGVMGAGLLTFTMRNLDSVVQVNQGQQALDIADAGVQAAIAHLRLDSTRQHYDTNSSNDCSAGKRLGTADWSPATSTWTDAKNCTGPTTRSASQAGVTRSFGGGQFQVTIQCFVQTGDSTTNPPCSGGANPNLTDPNPAGTTPASSKTFFRIISTGYYPSSGGAVRRVEAIVAAQLPGVPSSYYTPGEIDFNGGPTLKGVSFFAGKNITGVNTGSISVDRATPALYGDWYNPPYNDKHRTTSGVGFGAAGLVCDRGPSQCNTASDSYADGLQDFDSTTGTKGNKYQFVFKKDASGNPAPTRPLSANEISFPFDPGNLSDPSTDVNSSITGQLKAIAQEQGNYCTPSTCSSTVNTWPGYGSIYFFDGMDVTFKVNQTPLATGVIVVNNGNFTLNNSSNGFRGLVYVVGNGTTTGNFTTMGGTSMDGYAVASGTMSIGGNVSPATTFDYSSLLPLRNVNIWSWRECYDTTTCAPK